MSSLLYYDDKTRAWLSRQPVAVQQRAVVEADLGLQLRDGAITYNQYLDTMLPLWVEAGKEVGEKVDKEERYWKAFEERRASMHKSFVRRLKTYKGQQRAWYNRYKAQQIRWAVNTARKYPSLFWD